MKMNEVTIAIQAWCVCTCIPKQILTCLQLPPSGQLQRKDLYFPCQKTQNHTTSGKGFLNCQYQLLFLSSEQSLKGNALPSCLTQQHRIIQVLDVSQVGDSEVITQIPTSLSSFQSENEGRRKGQPKILTSQFRELAIAYLISYG